MNQLSDSQTELIIKWVKSQHLSIRSLENEFIDHICCDVEELMNGGKSFKAAFENLQRDLGDDLLPGLEKETILQLTYNQRIMKFLTRMTGIIVMLAFFVAIVTRFLEMELWRSIMAGGMVILGLGFVPLYFISHYRQQEVQGQKVLHLFGFIAAFLVPLSSFLGLFNSRYALPVMSVGVLFLVIGFIPLSWRSVSKGSGRQALMGSIIFLLFFVLISYGFLGIRISKDRVENWIFFSKSSEESGNALQKLNLVYIKKMNLNPELSEIANEIATRSDNLVTRLVKLRDDFIHRVSPKYKPEDIFFKGMDNHFEGQRFLIKNPATDELLRETNEFEAWLLSKLSEENELVRDEISVLLNTDSQDLSGGFDAKKNYLFRDYPVIADVSVINSMILNVRIAEYQTLKFLSAKNISNL